MGMISFFKVPQHRVYNYQPIYYDPEKERRRQRRIELGLADEDDKGTTEYKAGSLIKSGAMRKRHEQFTQTLESQKKRSQLFLIFLIISLSLSAYYIIKDNWDILVNSIF